MVWREEVVPSTPVTVDPVWPDRAIYPTVGITRYSHEKAKSVPQSAGTLSRTELSRTRQPHKSVTRHLNVIEQFLPAKTREKRREAHFAFTNAASGTSSSSSLTLPPTSPPRLAPSVPSSLADITSPHSPGKRFSVPTHSAHPDSRPPQWSAPT